MDRNAITRALMNLKTWDIPQAEIDDLHEEAKKICANKDAWLRTPEGRWVNREKLAQGGKLDPHKEAESPWGRVTLRAPFDGVIVEENVSMDEMIVDNTVNLFQIADVSRLLVTANCPEDDLPSLEVLQGNEKRWNVRTVGAASATGLSGTIADISYLIDPNQHTAIIKGYVDNPGQQIRAGQYVTATVNIPPPKDVVEIPVDALVDDGRQSLVFVQPDAAKRQFVMRRVQVTHRFDRTVFVRMTPIPKEEQLTLNEAEEGLLPKAPLRPGERVLTAGSVELKAALLDLESRPQEKPTDLLAKTKARPSTDLESPPEPKPKAGKG
jgi:cobalt-zinc-cadmium efflux system membrane fusion protein